MITSISSHDDTLHALIEDGRLPPLTWPSHYKDSPLQGPMADLDQNVEYFAKTMIEHRPDQTDTGYLKATKKRAVEYIRNPLNLACKVVISEKIARKKRHSEMHSVDGDKSMFPELRANILALPPMERVNVLLQTEHYPTAAACMEAGRVILQIDESIWTHFEKHFAMVRKMHGPGAANYLPATVTMENLTPSEPDWDGIKKEAQDNYAAFMASNDIIEAADQYIATIIPFIAGSATNLSNREVFELLIKP